MSDITFSSGVLGLNILTKFNVNMLFDEQLIKLTKIVNIERIMRTGDGGNSC